MKKFLVSALAMFVLGSVGSVFAQDVERTVEHDVRFTIPEVVMLRFTSGDSNAAVTASNTVIVDIEFGIELDDFNDEGGTYLPTNAPDWDDLKVFVNRNLAWSLTFELDNPVVPLGATWDWSEIEVTPNGGDFAVSAFNLAGTNIVTEASRRGWSSLGFGPQSFELTLDGSEVAGDYSATIIYTLTAP